jgi:3-deoxy-manno-octulosonate cytidylyltransferase (CMP-KDO synthetase)
MNILAVIPARYASTRFPGKPLAMIHGKPMIQWVYERSAACKAVDEVLVATDDERIYDVVRDFGGNVVMTSTSHPSGTDRIQEAVRKWGSSADIVVNVQGDEPAMDSTHLERLIGCFDGLVDIATLVTPINEKSTFEDPNRVKAVLASNGRALYFSRSGIPYHRGGDHDLSICYQHLGVYAYKIKVLEAICKLPPSPLEIKESLEQLRWLEHGYVVHAAIVDEAGIGVDTPQDLERVREMLR